MEKKTHCYSINPKFQLKSRMHFYLHSSNIYNCEYTLGTVNSYSNFSSVQSTFLIVKNF